MEYCGGGSVSDLQKALHQMSFENELNSGRTLKNVTMRTESGAKGLNELEIAYVAGSVLKALVQLHKDLKIHRDIKAGNILLNDDGIVKLADFGVVGVLNDANAKRCTVIGTPYWMAPEVIEEVGHDSKADIWSLGITCIEMAQGFPPLYNLHPMRAIFKIPNSPPPTLAFPKDFSDEFNDFISKCLVKNPDKRNNAKELLDHPWIKKINRTAAIVSLLDKMAISKEFQEEIRNGGGNGSSASTCTMTTLVQFYWNILNRFTTICVAIRTTTVILIEVQWFSIQEQ